MLISILSEIDRTKDILATTNVVDTTPAYNAGATYADKDLVKYNHPDDNYPESIYGVFNIVDSNGTITGHRLEYYSAVAPMAPFDNKNYSKATSDDFITYKIYSNQPFDTLALGRVMGGEVTVTFKTANNALVYGPVKVSLDCHLDSDGRLPPVPITKVIYSDDDVPAGGYAEFTINDSTDVPTCELGTALLGLSVQAGFTKLNFTNKYNDYSPQEVDQWGNVLYINGVKINVHSGTVDLPTAQYDKMNKLMLKLGADIVIVNGNGVKTNIETGSLSKFDSAVVIGRIKNFALKTNIKDKRMGDLATYTFTVEEIV